MTLATMAQVNLLRVWGGGLIEKEAFYEECDRLGIMVWQEFLQSSSGIDNNPPQTPEFIDMMVREVEQIIPRKRNHPSLALWCGGNELTSGEEKPLDDSHPLLAALKETVNRLDPDRLWLPTSPIGRVFMNSLENIARDPDALHDVHGPWEYQGVKEHYRLYNAGTALLHSEFGVEGITNLKTLNATIAPEHQQPATLDNPIWNHLGAWWVKQPMWQATFGEITDIETLVKATQMMQAEGLRYAVEANRRRKWHTSGTLPWQFNEPYPMAACTSAVDYYGRPKPAYYAVRQAYERLHLSASFPMVAWEGETAFVAQVWLNSTSNASMEPDPLKPFRNMLASLRARIVGLGGREYGSISEAVNVPINTAAALTSIRWPLEAIEEDVFLLEIMLVSHSIPLSHICYVFTRTANFAPLLSVGHTELDISVALIDAESRLTIANTGSVTALYVWLEDGRELNAAGYAYFIDNYFHLLPGESKSVSVIWYDVPLEERRIDISGWNVETRTIT
jgi:beta-mannosidase